MNIVRQAFEPDLVPATVQRSCRKACPTVRSHEPRAGNRHGHAAASAPILGLLFKNLLRQIPGENHGDIGSLVQQRVRTVHRNVMPGREQALLEGTPIDDKRYAVGADVAVGEQGIRLGGSSVAGQTFTSLTYAIQELEQFLLHMSYPPGKTPQRLTLTQTPMIS